MFILKKGHQPGVYVPLRALFLVFILFLFSIYFISANRISPAGVPRFAASHLELFCLPMSHKKDTRLMWLHCIQKPISQVQSQGSNGFVSSKIYDKRDDFDFDIVNFPFLDGDVPRRPSYGVYISQLIRFARVCSHVDDFHTRNKCLTAKLLKQGYRYHKLRKAFSKFYRRHYELISKFNVGLKSLLHQGLSEPEFYGDLVYKFKDFKIRGITDFSDQFRKIIMRYKRIGYNLNVMRQSACLVINPITVDGYSLIARRWIGRQTP